MPRLLSLDDVDARDPAVVGVKAANLARARSAGMPVLPGWVLPAGGSADAMRAGAEAFARSGSAAACLAVADTAMDGEPHRQLTTRASATGGTFVVRSSTSFDDDPRWAGAFATYLDVTPEDLFTAVRGCWASAFTRDVTQRGERLGLTPWARGVGVLVQPHAVFDVGGTATVGPDRCAKIAMAAGGPAGIVGGVRTGSIVEIREGADATDVVGPTPADTEMLLAVAALVRAVSDASGNDAIEWGATSAGTVTLLQSGRAAPGRAERPAARRSPRAPVSEAALRLAAAADRCPAPLGEAWVLPWAAAMAALPSMPVLAIENLVAALDEARELASSLSAGAWGAPTPAAAATFRAALGSPTDSVWERLAELHPVDPAAAARVLGLVGAVGRRLTDLGRLSHPDAVWRRSAAELAHAASDASRTPDRSGPDRWEPFVFDVVDHHGDELVATPAAPGTGAGRPVVVRGPNDLVGVEPRRVLVLTRPIPQVAPLVWRCAAIVSADGSPGAHLFEVARSLGVAAVVGVDLMETDADTIIAVDGNAGRVTSWKPSLNARSGAIGA